eukprot:CAMPEP_0176059834 /NCGR_PEP_ID=MMETSP0120_2-20121206/29819_1 /TAXON_ID=160619 /ORGANISM="Kryptoperidinium foliaceum, Strain CCMP 1326" /LENGTH=247 /DNA_ID=CAMNT_0017393371 /DNA_START=93 /DNA_END=837 /DNA_ORIENTATION=+
MSDIAGSHAFLRILQEAQEKDQKNQEKMLQREAQLMKSLQIPSDERYKKMQFFQDHGATGHFEHLVEQTRAEGDCVVGDIPVQRSTFEVVEPEEREPRRQVPGVGGRIEWQEAFDKQIRSLMVDFQLTDEPATRLKHLDQMHAWFQDHGGKQRRKVAKGPEYLTADRDSTMPPGSTKNLAGMSATSLQLAGAYAMLARGARPPPKEGGSCPRVAEASAPSPLNAALRLMQPCASGRFMLSVLMQKVV